jgi:hypothetical protein
MFRRLLLPAILITLSACASEDPGGPDGPGRRKGGDHRPDGPPPVRLFISPSGEPFRGEDGLGRWIAQVDTDHDGAVSQAEFRADAIHSFKVLDTNGDGVIDGFELQHYEREIVPEIGVLSFDAGPTAGRPERGGGRRAGDGGGGGGMGGRGGGGMGGGGMGGGGPRAGGGPDRGSHLPPTGDTPTRVPGAGREGAARYSLINEPEPIAAADANFDGKVTLPEWMAITDRRFAKLDHLKNGKLTRDSLLHPPPRPKGAPKSAS